MFSTQSPIVGNQKLLQKRARKPLQPRNFPTNTADDLVKNKPKEKWIEISVVGDSNKENLPICVTPMKIEPLDASLAEELSAIRKKLERLRLEKEKTEKMLRQRDLMLERVMSDLETRGKEQRKVEIEVEKLQRLKEIRTSCMLNPPIQSLREIEQEKKIKEAQLKEVKSEEK